MQLRRALQKACKAAEIFGFTFHDFRHCALTRWHTMKVPAATAMRMAGQSSVQSFKKYINMDAREHAEVFTNCLQEYSAPANNSATA
jgi:integrase